MYSITEASKKLNLSRVTVYSKIKDKNVKPYLKIVKGKTYITDKGIEAIQQLIQCKDTNVNHTENSKDNLIDKTQNKRKTIDNIDNVNLQEAFILLNKQLEVKDLMINDLLEQLKTKDKLMENMQIIFSQEQTKGNLLNGSPGEIKENWFSRIFKSKTNDK